MNNFTDLDGASADQLLDVWRMSLKQRASETSPSIWQRICMVVESLDVSPIETLETRVGDLQRRVAKLEGDPERAAQRRQSSNA
jgi:polyhydroxyalkanoate synthesis regulator phasin